MKVMILGYGQVGKVLAYLLARESSVKAIVCGDLSIKEGSSNGKIGLKNVDLADKQSLSELMGGIKPDIVVNTALPLFNTNIMDSCLENNANYLDAASYWEVDETENAVSPYKIEQLDYHLQFKAKKIIGLINAGVSPGLTNLLAKESIIGFDEVDHIKIRLLEETKVDKTVFSWCKEWLIDEIECKPLVYTGNKFLLSDGHSDEEYEFPAPFGRRKVTHIAQDEVGTLPLYLKVKNVDIKSYDDQAELIKKHIIASENSEGSNENDIDIRTVGEAQFGFALEAIGKQNGREKMVKHFVAFPKQKEINALGVNANFVTYPTALMMKAFVLAINKIKSFGVFPPEALDAESTQVVLEDIKKSGIKILKSEVISNYL